MDKAAFKHKIHLVVNLVLAALCVVAVAISVYGIDRAIPWAGDDTYYLSEPSEAVRFDDGRFLTIDNDQTRVTFFNADKQVVSYFDQDNKEVSLSEITATACDQDTYYLAGHTISTTSAMQIDKELIVKGTFGSDDLEIVYEQDPGEGDLGITGTLCDITTRNGNVYGVFIENEFVKVKKIIDKDRAQTIHTFILDDEGILGGYSAAYNPVCDVCAVVTLDGSLRVYSADGEPQTLFNYYDDTSVRTIDVDDDGCIYYADNYAQLLHSISKDGTIQTLCSGDFTDISISKGVVSACNSFEGSISFYDLNTEEVSTNLTFTYSKATITFSHLRMASHIYIALFAICLIVFTIKKRGMKSTTLRNLFIGIGSLVLILGITTFFSVLISLQHINTSYKSIATAAYYYSECAYEDQQEAFSLIEDDDATPSAIAASEKKLRDYFNTYCNAASKAGEQVYFRLFINDDKVGYVTLTDSYQQYQMFSRSGTTSTDFDLSAVLDTKSVGGITPYLDISPYGTFLVVQTTITDAQGNDLATLEMGNMVEFAIVNIEQQLVPIVIAILVLLAALYLCIQEVRELLTARRRVSALNKQGYAGAEFAATRPFIFVITGVLQSDAVLLVLMAQQFFGSDVNDNALLVSLPILMFGLGSIVGPIAYGFLSHRVTIRKLMFVCTLLTFVSCIVMVCSFGQGDFKLYCVAKFLQTSFASTILAMGTTLPMRAKTEEDRFDGYGRLGWAPVASSVLTVIIAGAISQYIGYSFVYVFVALISLLLVPLIAVFLPKHTYFDSRKQQDRSVKHALLSLKYVRRYLASPAILALFAFMALPAVLTSGYESYLFPLYSDNIGISAVLISDLYALARVLAYACGETFTRVTWRFGHWKCAILSLCITGYIFLLFVFNTSIYWAVAVLALTSLTNNATTTAAPMLWGRMAQKLHFPLEMAVSISLVMDGLGNALLPFFLAVYQLMGPSFACPALGLYILISAVFFALITRKSAMNHENSATLTT